MGAIIDTLYLGIEDLSLVKAKYPECVVVKQSHSDYIVQKYMVVIPTDNDSIDNYYIFLIGSGIAMSSVNFIGRITSDQKFGDRMRIRISEFLKNYSTEGLTLEGQ